MRISSSSVIAKRHSDVYDLGRFLITVEPTVNQTQFIFDVDRPRGGPPYAILLRMTAADKSTVAGYCCEIKCGSF